VQNEVAKTLSLSKPILSSSLLIKHSVYVPRNDIICFAYEAACIVCYAFHTEVSNLVIPTKVKNFFAKCGFPVDHQVSHTSQFKKML